MLIFNSKAAVKRRGFRPKFSMKNYTQEQLLALRDSQEAWLMAQPGVTGTGIGLDARGQLVLRIFTKGISASTRQSIAGQLPHVPLDWEEGDVIAY